MSPDDGPAASARERAGRGQHGARDPDQASPSVQPGLWRAGRTGWSLVGIAVAVALGALALGQLSLVVVPVVLALFPATLLVPVSDWLKDHRLPAALAALIAVVGGMALIALIFGLMVPFVMMELPDLTASAAQGLTDLQGLIEDRFGLQVGGFSDLLEQGADMLGEAGDVAGQAASAAGIAVSAVTGALIMLVVLFFFLKDGRALADGLLHTAPSHLRPHLRAMTDRAWTTLSAYFRGQMLVALTDAVLIGIGLLVLGVPLALPLAVLIFFGGLFPIVGAVASGALAVLVAFADGGLVSALIVLGLVLVVQQLEGNVLQPYILGHAIDLHPLVVLLAIAAGGITIGVLGAFLAVPVAAVFARSLDYLRGENADASAAS